MPSSATPSAQMSRPPSAAARPPAQPLAAAQSDVHYTVFIRLPFARGDFVDPPSVGDFSYILYSGHVGRQGSFSKKGNLFDFACMG